MMAKNLITGLALAMVAGLAQAATPAEFVGTDAPFASNAIYFVMTDRFVNGDPSNDHRDQGGAHRTFDVPVAGAPKGESANIGYLGGDFKGVLDNAGYIRGMGFGAVWITPIVDNPDEAFTGGDPVSWGSKFTDRGKTGFHGYWGVNFYKLDEHLPSKGLDFRQFTAKMHSAGLKVVQDIVVNHGSPAFSMPVRQPQYGQIFDKNGKLVADQQNLPPYQLDPVRNPLHRFYHAYDDLVQLSNNDDQSPAVLDYFVGAYEQWIGEGADAFRIDTISHMSTAFWKQFSARIRAKHPGFFMFGEAFDYSPDNIGQYTWPSSGAISVLDFPLRGRIAEVFERPGSDYAHLLDRLYLTNGPYQNPYELVTFYDNHDMARLKTDDAGFIDANNWLFTARGIPAIYYGSETGFERGKAEHEGNRNYYGQQRIDNAAKSPVYRQLKRIALLRESTPAMQRGLMLPLRFAGNQAAFYRVYQKGDTHQIALVLLNKGDAVASFDISDYLQPGRWQPALGGSAIDVAEHGRLRARVPAHDVQVYLLDAAATHPELVAELTRLMEERGHPVH
ncbi:MAG: cyclomaltodextrin glucanotransferase [Rhodanobacter sp.]|uniref:alpha-amylase family glycosyl hydrolase n=2 Tax=Rhodanobacteraceae TaxID=1775411 RepID=UPI0004868A20|nr:MULTISPECIES: alpha-amylase family glycosyl hydrolase [Rhodanobacter]TAN16838.1 MAG: cyclomaltodextrin glucanotransferase [Rhodanobacter sp.]UJJ54347.1 cyclomaltodextrin glucanotransferase [Rhodanobacter thiooxydans]